MYVANVVIIIVIVINDDHHNDTGVMAQGTSAREHGTCAYDSGPWSCEWTWV